MLCQNTILLSINSLQPNIRFFCTLAIQQVFDFDTGILSCGTKK